MGFSDPIMGARFIEAGKVCRQEHEEAVTGTPVTGTPVTAQPQLATENNASLC